jgi:ferredoxin
MPKVVIANEKKEIEVPEGSNLRQELMKAGVPVYGTLESYLNCRGLGLCGTCKILVKKGMENLNGKTIMEKFNFNFHPMTMMAYIGHEEEMRLSCQVEVKGDCTIETRPPLNLSGETFWQKPYPNK